MYSISITSDHCFLSSIPHFSNSEDFSSQNCDTFSVKILSLSSTFKYNSGNSMINLLLLLNHFYPVMSYRPVRKESDGFGHSLWSANSCQRKWLTSTCLVRWKIDGKRVAIIASLRRLNTLFDRQSVIVFSACLRSVQNFSRDEYSFSSHLFSLNTLCFQFSSYLAASLSSFSLSLVNFASIE